MYRLLIIWNDGQKEENYYGTEEEAKEIQSGYYMAFGSQVQFSCIEKVN